MAAELDVVEVAAFQALAWTAAIALPLSYISWGGRRQPWLGIIVTSRVALDYGVRVFLWSVPVGSIVTVVIGDSRRGALVTFAIGLLYAWLRSIAGDVFMSSRVLHFRRKGDRDAMLNAASHAVHRLQRHRSIVGVKMSYGITELVAGSGLIPEAERILAALPRERYIGVPLWCLQHALAILRLRLGNYDHAAEALDHCGGFPPSAELEREHRFLRALVDIGHGKPASGRKRMRDDDLEANRLVVDAHAFAAAGNEDEARAALERLRALPGGEGELQLLALGKLPARVLALRLLRMGDPEED